MYLESKNSFKGGHFISKKVLFFGETYLHTIIFVYWCKIILEIKILQNWPNNQRIKEKNWINEKNG
jgi:hypothetical protein